MHTLLHLLVPIVLLVSVEIRGVAADGPACPASLPAAPSHYVNVGNDTELLAAVKNNNVAGILLTRGITLGTSWVYSDPIMLKRNLTIGSTTGLLPVPGTFPVLDFSHYTGLIQILPNITITFANLTITGQKRNPLNPGLDIVSWTADSTNKVVFSNVHLMPGCCLPPTGWDAYVAGLGTTASYIPNTRFVCQPDGTCWNQTVTFSQMCALIAPPGESYLSVWSNVEMLCNASVTADCVATLGSLYCLEQCISGQGAPDTPPDPSSPPSSNVPSPAAGQSTEPKDDSSNANRVKAIVWASVVPTVIVGLLVVAWIAYRAKRKQMDENGDCMDSGKAYDHDVDSSQDGFHAIGDIEAKGQLPGAEPPAMSPNAKRQPASGDSQGLRVPSGHKASPASRSPVSTTTFSKDALGSPHLTMEAPGADMPRQAVRADGARVLSTGNFDTAAAIASILLRQQQEIEEEPMDMNKRVQRVAEEREISQDEKLIIGKPIGKGAFGMVYRGLWRNLEVAVKTVLFSQNDSVRQENAVIEAALASSVNHPNVVALYHYDLKPVTAQHSAGRAGGQGLHIEDDGRSAQDWKMYLVLELCQTSLAETLDKFVFHEEQTGLPRLDLILAVLMDVAAGCAHIHSKNIIWGDLKPENVLLKMDPSRPHGIIAKITDFGMSTTIDPTASHISGFNRGTPCYAAPEVLLSHQATKTTDIFSFGILMQQVISRMTPCTVAANGGIEVNMKFWRPVAGAPPAYTALRQRCLDQEPKNRPGFDVVLQTLSEIYNAHMDSLQLAAAEAEAEGPSGS